MGDLANQPARISFWSNWVGRIMPASAGPVAQTELLEAALYFKALEKGVLIFHAAGISIGKEAYIIAAKGGTGKTTTVMRLLQSDPAGQFLGDDHVLVSRDMTTYSYPRPLHIFRSTLKDFPELNISGSLRVIIHLKAVVASLFTQLTGQRFFLSTRVPVEAICPGTVYGPPAPLATIIALQTTGGTRRIDLHDPAERGAFAEHLLTGGGINQILWDRLLASHPESRRNAQQLEMELLDTLLKKMGKAYIIDRQAAGRLTGIQSLKDLLSCCDKNALGGHSNQEPPGEW